MARTYGIAQLFKILLNFSQKLHKILTICFYNKSIAYYIGCKINNTGNGYFIKRMLIVDDDIHIRKLALTYFGVTSSEKMSIISEILNAHEMEYVVDCADGITSFWFQYNMK